ncbi:MAG: S-layer homology domain-containing protein [Ruminococcaceae bacterium]|nr:S-layer homology domain-containing protein [Oscillospiraceae bacterium]
MKKLLTALLILCQLTVIAALPAFAAETVIVDEFDYEETQFQYEGKINENWAVIAPSGALLSGKVNARMTGSALETTGVSSSYTSYVNRVACVAYTGDYSGVGDTYRIKFHFDKYGDNGVQTADTNVGFGVRFANDTDVHSYYRLWFTGAGDGDKNIWTFAKISRGTVTEATVKSEETWSNASATANGGGILMTADVEIIVSGENISWNINGLRYGDFEYVSGGSFYDSNPYDAKTVGFSQTNGSSTYTLENAKPGNVKTTLTTNFSIENVEEYVDFEPANAFYKVFTNDCSEFPATKIRRIYVPDLPDDILNATFTAADGSTTEKTVRTDSQGWWVNLGDETEYTGVKFEDWVDTSRVFLINSVDGLETDYTISVGDEGVKPVYPRIGNAMNLSSYTWATANEKIATVDKDGGLNGINRGETVITVSKGTIEYKINLTVKGEIDTAEENGTINEYIADKKPVIDEFNRIAEADDEAAMNTFLTSEEFENTKLAYIKDIDRGEILALAEDDPEAFALYVKRMLTYSNLVLNGVSDINKLQKLLDTEVTVGKFNGIEDAETAKETVKAYETEMGFNTENEYYQDYQDKIYEAIIEKGVFDSLKDLQDVVKETYVMNAFKDSMGYKTMVDIAEKCADEIGYDTDKFETFYSLDIGSYLLNNKKNINSVAELKEAIDSFVQEEKVEEKKEKKTTSGGSSGGISSKGVVISNDIVQEAAKPVAEDNAPIFTDVSKNDWYYDYVRYLKGTGVLNGYEDGGFHPGSDISRAEFIKTLVAACGLTGTDETEFSDVSEADWYNEAVKIAAANGILFGSEGKANPNAKVTREEMAAFLYRTCEVLGIPFDGSNAAKQFTDDEDISDWAYVQVTAVKNLGFISGYEDGSFKPHGNATRAEAMTLISKFKASVEEGK